MSPHLWHALMSHLFKLKKKKKERKLLVGCWLFLACFSHREIVKCWEDEKTTPNSDEKENSASILSQRTCLFSVSPDICHAPS